MTTRLFPLIVLPFLATVAASADDGPKPEGASPEAELPPTITRLTDFGERADFSHDGKRVLFLSRTFGDAFEVDLATRRLRLLTGHYPHGGYTRALYLADGSVLLSGPERFDPTKTGDARVQCVLSVLDASATKPPVPLGTKCSEGPAVSRSRMRIAWTHVAAQYPDTMAPGSSRIQEADIVIEDGKPKLANQKVVLESKSLPFKCTLESQNFIPPNETALTFSAYGHQGTDVCIVDLKTGEARNVSNALNQYDEPEGIFPDGKHTLVECDRENVFGLKGSGPIDLWKLALDGSGAMTRLTRFTDYPGYKASNGVISDDGARMAFQIGRARDAAGVGYGIFLYDLTRSAP